MDGFKAPQRQHQEEEILTTTSTEKAIRPLLFDDYIGQDDAKEHLSVLIKAAKMQQKSLAHTLIFGPPGLGKTTLATIIANEMEKKIHYTSAPAIEKPADLVSLLVNLEKGDILFIDEIHRLKIQTEELLYLAMEDNVIDIAIPNGTETKVVRLNINNFTLIGATTKPGKLSGPLRDRFYIKQQLKFYDISSLKQIIKRTSSILGFSIEDDAAFSIAQRARGTARIANMLLNNVGDYAVVKNNGIITQDFAINTLNAMKIDEFGLENIDRKVIYALYVNHKNKPTGLKNLSTSIQEEMETIESVIEPYLLQKNLINRTERGRILTDLGIEYAKKLVNSDFVLD